MQKEKNRKVQKENSMDKDITDELRKHIFLHMEKNSITLNHISESADIPFQTINSLLYGKTRNIMLSTAIRIAIALDLSIDELTGSRTLDPSISECITTYRDLPENSKYLVHWFLQHQKSIHSGRKGRRIISVMKPVCQMNGNLRPANDFHPLDISHLGDNIRPKVFIGFQLPCSHYMPHYSPYDILLVANDRLPNLIENSVVISGGNLFVAKRRIRNGKAAYYSIRDGKFRSYEDDMDEVIGYIAGVIKSEVL